MRIISFMWFKKNCKHAGNECCFNDEYKEYLNSGDELSDYPCSEKNCPVLQACAKYRKERK